MVRQLDAVYEHGILRPLEPLALLERQRVRLTLEEGPQSPSHSWDSPQPVNERLEEFQWLANESGPYAGKWIALDGGRLIAHGDDLASVRAAAQDAGIQRPLLTYLPVEGGLPFAGW